MIKLENKISQTKRAIETLEKVGIEESLIQLLKDAVKGWEKEQEQIIKGHTIKYYGLGIVDYKGKHKYYAVLYGVNGGGQKGKYCNSLEEIEEWIKSKNLGKYKSNGFKTYKGAADREEWLKSLIGKNRRDYTFKVIEVLTNEY